MVRNGLIVAIVVFSFLATVPCTGRLVNVSKRQLRQLKKLASDQQQPLEEKDDLGREKRQAEKAAKSWTNARLQTEVQDMTLKVNSLDTSIANMKPDYRGYKTFINDNYAVVV